MANYPCPHVKWDKKAAMSPIFIDNHPPVLYAAAGTTRKPRGRSSRSELVRISVLTSVLGSRPTLPHGFSVTRGDISRYEIPSRVGRISTGICSSRSCAQVYPCAQPMAEGEVHARRTCRKNPPPHSPARLHSDPRRRQTSKLATIRDSIRTWK